MAILLLGAVLALLFPDTNQVKAQSNDAEQPTAVLNKDSSFDFDILSRLGLATSGGSDIAPLLAAARNIIPGDFDSFSQVSYELANQTKALAQDPELAYDAINVRDTWFSAATYFRMADFYLHGDPADPLIDELWVQQTAAFDNAVSALDVPGQRLQIAADDFTVNAIWFPVAADDKQRPTIILGNGYDGAQEDLYHSFVTEAHLRGWNALTYEGPGQPSVRRGQNLGFIPDWERVVTPVVDYLLTNQSSAVDPSRLLLLGYSFGGYLAARAAAFEHRITGLILDGGVWDVFQDFYNQLPEAAQALYDTGNATEFNDVLTPIIYNTSSPTGLRWGATQGMWSFNVPTPYDLFQAVKAFNATTWISRIQVPTFVADASLEGFFPNGSVTVADAIGSQATYHLFSDFSGYHCQVGSLQSLNRVLWAWVHKNFGSVLVERDARFQRTF